MAKIFHAVVLLSFLLVMPNAFAAAIEGKCGLYELRSTIEKNPTDVGYLYIVNKGALSQYQFTIRSNQQLRIAPYVDRSSKARVRFSKPIEGYRGVFDSIDSIELAAPDPLGLSGEKTLMLISEQECVK